MNNNTKHPSWIEIDIDQFKKNLLTIKKFIGKTLLCLPIKANAYGHGLYQIAYSAIEAGVDYLAVAHAIEGVKLRQAGIHIPILVMGAIHEDQIDDLIEYDLEFTIGSRYKADLVATKINQNQKKCRIHLEIDTGMQRTGVKPSSAVALFQYLQTIDIFDIVGIYTHLAGATGPEDRLTFGQIEVFQSLLRNPIFNSTPLIKHISNSGGMLYYPEAHMDMVRPSMAAFGYISGKVSSLLADIRPFFSLKSKVSYFKVVEEGKGISYGHSYTTSRQTRIVTVPVGYGDGFRRCLSNLGNVIIRGKRFPIVGNICMDQFMVDIGEHEVYVGDEVVLIGRQGDEEITVEEIAGMCGTIPYEVLCFFNDRLPRVYKEYQSQCKIT